jgi:mannose-6-phosphate isomerase-like protein (cupin superfamily)
LPKKISKKLAAEAYGIGTSFELMENGECRFRLVDRDGNGYVLTIASRDGAWQRSHFHLKRRETYIVERGWMALATAIVGNSDFKITLVEAGGSIATQPGQSHNVYLSAGAVIHTVKHGGGSGEKDDWEEDEDLDLQTRGLTETKIRELSSMKKA